MRIRETGIILALILFAVNVQADSTFDDCYNNCRETCDKLAPNVLSYCAQNNLNCSKILTKIVDTGESAPHEGGTYIGTHGSMGFQSPKCLKEERTYFRSNTPLVYQMMRISEKQFLVLYSKDKPWTILKSLKSRWNLAIVDVVGKIIDNKQFTTNWKYDNKELEIWSMINTGIKILNEHEAVIEIYYEHTGSGSWTQGHESHIFYDGKTLKIRTKQVVDDAKGKI